MDIPKPGEVATDGKAVIVGAPIIQASARVDIPAKEEIYLILQSRTVKGPINRGELVDVLGPFDSVNAAASAAYRTAGTSSWLVVKVEQLLNVVGI